MSSFPGKEGEKQTNKKTWIHMCIPEIESRRNSRTPKDRVPGHIAWNSLKLPASLLPGMFVLNADSWAPPQTYWHSWWGPAVNLCLTKLLRSLWHMPMLKSQWYQQQNGTFQAQIKSQLPPDIISHQWFRNASMKVMGQESRWACSYLLQVTSKDSPPPPCPWQPANAGPDGHTL